MQKDRITMRKICQIAVNKINKKGQGEFHPALVLLGSLFPNEDKRSSTESRKNIALKNIFVKSGTHKSLLPAFMCSISTPRAGFELASDLSVEDRFIQLSYRGVLSFDNRTSNFDNYQ